MPHFRNRAHNHSPEEQQKLWDEYQGAIGLKGATFSSEAFDKLVQGRVKDADDLASIEEAAAQAHYKKLSEAEKDADNNVKAAAEAVQGAIFDALAITDEFAQAQKDFNESLAAFKELVRDIPEKYNARGLIKTMKEVIEKGRKSIEEQQKHEKEQLEAQFENADFVNNLKIALNIPDSEVGQVKKDMLADLGKKHQQQLEEFTKSIEESENVLHKAAAAETEEFLFFAGLHKSGNEKMLRLISQLAAQKAKEDEEERKKAGLPPKPLAAVVGFGPDKVTFSGLKVKDLPFIETCTGQTITQESPGTFTMNVPSSLNVLYHWSPKNNLDHDMLMIIGGVKASGCNAITFKSNFPNDPDKALLIAQKAYASCIEYGFLPKDITVEVNGNAMKAEDLFKKHPQKIKEFEKRSEEVIKRRAEIGTNSGIDDSARIKAAMQDIRAKNAAAAYDEEDKTLSSRSPTI